MPTFTLRSSLAIAQIILFTPSLLYAYSFHRTSNIGGFTIGLFSLLRLTAASTRLASLRTTTYICESLGIILLIFLYQEFLERINKVHPLLPRHCFTLISLITLFDLGLTIGSWVTMSTRTTPNVLLPTRWTTASTALIFLVFVYEVGLFGYFVQARRTSPSTFGTEECRLLLAPALQTVPMVVRNLHPVVFVGTGKVFWNQVVGNGVVYLCMIMIPEVVVVAVAVWCIRKVEPLVKDGEGMKGGAGGRGGGAVGAEVPSQDGHPPRDGRQSLGGGTLPDRADVERRV